MGKNHTHGILEMKREVEPTEVEPLHVRSSRDPSLLARPKEGSHRNTRRTNSSVAMNVKKDTLLSPNNLIPGQHAV